MVALAVGITPTWTTIGPVEAVSAVAGYEPTVGSAVRPQADHVHFGFEGLFEVDVLLRWVLLGVEGRRKFPLM